MSSRQGWQPHLGGAAEWRQRLALNLSREQQTSASYTSVGPCQRAGIGRTLASRWALEPLAKASVDTTAKPLPNPFEKEVLMNLTISGHHLEVTPALREYVLTKLDRVTRHFDQVVDVNVLLTVEKLREKERRQKAEVTLHSKGKDIFVEQSSEDMYAAIDELMDKLDRQVCRHKDKLQAHHHESSKRLDVDMR
jgi:putative sigma-54 modulation protein